MENIILKDRQTLWDLALQYCGDREAAFDIADINDISFTEELSAGTSVIVPDVINRRVVGHYKANNTAPATAIAEQKTITDNTIIANDGSIMVANDNNNIQIVTNV